jgi:hypothetical protein
MCGVRIAAAAAVAAAAAACVEAQQAGKRWHTAAAAGVWFLCCIAPVAWFSCLYCACCHSLVATSLSLDNCQNHHSMQQLRVLMSTSL